MDFRGVMDFEKRETAVLTVYLGWESRYYRANSHLHKRWPHIRGLQGQDCSLPPFPLNRTATETHNATWIFHRSCGNFGIFSHTVFRLGKKFRKFIFIFQKHNYFEQHACQRNTTETVAGKQGSNARETNHSADQWRHERPKSMLGVTAWRTGNLTQTKQHGVFSADDNTACGFRECKYEGELKELVRHY